MRPIVYKGPSNHLTQFFEMSLLYQGMCLLLDDLLMDWQYEKETGQVTGIFLYESRLIKTQLAWPLSDDKVISYCDCQSNNHSSHNHASETDDSDSNSLVQDGFDLDSLDMDSSEQCSPETDSSGKEGSSDKESFNNNVCVHLAALAIETKMHLDQLPQPAKQAEAFNSQSHYLVDWLSKQSFDPFPNMARHRVIYLLDQSQESGEVFLTCYKAYLTKQNEYQKKAVLPLSVMDKNKLPKFVSLTDQQILQQLQALIHDHPELSQNNYIYLPSKEQAVNELIKNLIVSGRLFWRNCYRHSLQHGYEYTIHSDWLKLSESFYLDQSKSHLIEIKREQNNSLISKAIQLDKRFQSEKEPLEKKPNWQLCLDISSEQVELPWLNKKQDIDIAQVKLLISDELVELESVFDAMINQKNKAFNQEDKPPQLINLLDEIAGHLHQIDILPGIRTQFEPPISHQFDGHTRILDGDLSHWFPLFRYLQKDGWKISINNNFCLNQKKINYWYSQVFSENSDELVASDSLPTEQNWFDLEVGVKVDDRAINIMPYIVQLLKQDYQAWLSEHLSETVIITLDDETRVEIETQRIKHIINVLLELYQEKPLTQEKRLRLPTTHLHRLVTLQKHTDEMNWKNSEWLKTKAEDLAKNTQLDLVAIPDNLNAKLRHYQHQGFSWLQFLAKENFAGILADDMGLGKTIQTLTHIQCEKNNGCMGNPCMVVAPKSVLSNWLSESAKFTPDLKIIYWSGSKRHDMKEELATADLIITSYGVLLRDAEEFFQQALHLLVLDEAHMIKNAKSKIAKQVFALQSKHRLCLTGTPLENNLGELWSLFNFLMPGFLGTQNQFNQLFRMPIEKDQNKERQQLLAERISPFMLRRIKDKVAADLPQKNTIEIFIELEAYQADVYETVRLSMLDEVKRAISSTGTSKNQLLIGNALLRLRQICCHPNLIKEKAFQEPEKIVSNYLTDYSAKLTWLKEKLPEMIISGRKILIFSSFTSMLDLIAELLQEIAIDYLSLTGKTTKREEKIASFQQGNVSVFLISLKAGGTGLNLTQADTVIHVDPWWNPAAENQASDRAHRIGQDKPVFIYKLIAKGTVEERINKMQKEKQQLADSFYEKTELKQIQNRDWESLLAPITTFDKVET